MAFKVKNGILPERVVSFIKRIKEAPLLLAELFLYAIYGEGGKSRFGDNLLSPHQCKQRNISKGCAYFNFMNYKEL